MKALLFLLTISVLYINLAVGQEKTFTLNGKINIDTGSVKLIMVGDSNLYPKSVRHLISPIIKGQFTFKNTIPYPMAYMLATTRSSYASGVIVIEPGIQSVKCNVDSSRKVPQITNKVMQEYARYMETTKEFQHERSLFEKEDRALRENYPNGIPEALKSQREVRNQALYDEGDRMLLAYIKENPGSYWALWRVIFLTQFGYEKTFDNMMIVFDDSIRNSYLGKRLSQILQKSNILAVGNKFPQMDLLQINGVQSQGISFTNSKYTLVDFWYTSCGPCLKGFPSLVKAYNGYHDMGFEIAGIATDASKYKMDLPVVIKKHGLKWLQYWDIGGEGASNLSISAFPTNFLVDANGVIVQKNIGGSELAVFLKNNL
jgi:thiol-disulfide isomerase/thioredoxin